MNRDAHLLGDVLDICPAGCFVTPEAAPLAVALDLLRQSGQRPNLTALATPMQSRWAKDPELWPAPDMARMAELSTSAWGLKGHAESLARKLADEHRRAELHARDCSKLLRKHRFTAWTPNTSLTVPESLLKLREGFRKP